MSASRKRRFGNVLGCSVIFIATLVYFQLSAAQADERNLPFPEIGNLEESMCVETANRRLHSFVQGMDVSCDNPQRQRICQEHLSHLAIPELMNSKFAEGCNSGCQFHAIVSEAGGKALNKLAFSAFLRAFIVTQPRDSKIYIWSLPWDNIQIPDIKQGCSLQSSKLGDESWRQRIEIKRFERADLGTLNLLKMMTYRIVGNEFRLLRSMVRLSDLLRFRLLRQYGGIYVDSDVMLLRDLSPLCNSTFTYRWSDKDAENSAVFGCPKNCRFVNEYMRGAGLVPLSYHPLKWRRVGKQIRHWPVRLPTIVFDPVWLKHIGSDLQDPAHYPFTRHEDFVKETVHQTKITSRSQAFPASLGYHWHGGFAAIPESPEPKSTFSQLHDLACF